MLDVDDLIGSCRDALTEDEPRRAVKEVLQRAVADPAPVLAALPADRGSLHLLHCSEELTVLQIVWAPGMRLYPHDHDMWACIGIYAGTEDNEFFRRPPDHEPGLQPSGGRRLEPGSVALLGHDTIHAVANPSSHRATGALHAYGGNFVTRPRRQWREPELVEEPYDLAVVTAQFDAANAEWDLAKGGGT